MYLSWPAFNNIRMLMMAFMPVMIFYIICLINTSERIRSEEGALLDLVCWPDGNAIPVIIACGSMIAVVVELYGLYQLFKAGLPKREYNVSNGLYYYIWALIINILIFLAIMFYSGLQSTIIRAKLKGGITKAMLRYSNHLPSKIAIDKLQTKFHCCGRVDYHEWFYIPWYNIEDEKQQNIRMSSRNGSARRFVGDNVPYSCCSMDSLWPCIHHGVMKNGTIYKYNPSKHLTIWNSGCEEKLITEMMTVSWRFNSVMALIILAMIGQIIAVRYLHTAYRNGLHVEHQKPRKAYLLRSRTHEMESEVRNFAAQPIQRKHFRRRKYRFTRTIQCIKRTSHQAGRISATTSSDERNSSDGLLYYE